MDLRRTKRVLGRGMRLRCPSCGVGRVFEPFLKTNQKCPSCGMTFLREHGYFIGAIYINVIVTEGLIGLVYLIFILTGSANDQIVFGTLFALAIAIPILFYRHARSLWLSFDYLIDPPKKKEENPLPWAR